MAERKFDPEAVADFQRILKDDLNHITENVIPRMRDGDLSYMPAFGLEGVAGKVTEYQTSFDSIWTDVQYIKVTIEKMLEALDEVVGEEAEAEEVNVQEIDQYLSMGESVPTDSTGNPDYNAELT